MKVFFEVKVLAVVPKEFYSNEGDEVKYNEVYLENENEDGVRDVVKVNSKLPALMAGSAGVAQFDVDMTGKTKPRLVAFTPKST